MKKKKLTISDSESPNLAYKIKQQDEELYTERVKYANASIEILNWRQKYESER